MFTLAIRAVLDTCRTAAEASSFLERIPHLGNTAFLVADAAGEIAAVDASPDEVRTTWFPDGFGFLANRYASEEMAACAPDEDVSGSDARSRTIRSWFEARMRIGMGEVQRVMCDVADVYGESEDPEVTLWSWTAALGDPVMYLAKGTPNETPYDPAPL